MQAPLDFEPPQRRREQVRAYLKGLKAEGLDTLPFRDLRGDMAVWAKQFQAALAPAMYRARGRLLDELTKGKLETPDVENQERGVPRIQRTGKAVAAELHPPGFQLPPLAMAMLAEALEELRDRLGERNADVIRKMFEDAVRNILVQNGFLSSLLSGHSGMATSFVFHVATYVKAVFGMDGTSQGVAAAIVRNIEKNEREAATRFIASTYTTLSGTPGFVEIHWPQEDMDGDSDAAKEHAALKRELFIDTWNRRGRKSMEFPSRGLWHFLEADGRFKRWNTPASLADRLSASPSDELPAVILHVAGPNLLLYVRQYLLGGKHGKALGLRPDAAFKPELAVLLRREQDEDVLDFRAVDDDFSRDGLVSEDSTEKGDEIARSKNAASSRKVRLEVRLQIRFRQPDLFQMHSALIVKAEY
ncbi:hypothetical protein [Noviherbaspirillum pedocola]|uniref:hypothetical protein n=1 Tax=Noviherbaspirillum pedocola TaxID=2801341 RepID=UPI001F26FA44|nr:hypothetical protein [Noviherbaspirillum pedocola]